MMSAMRLSLLLLPSLCLAALSAGAEDREPQRWQFDNGELRVQASPRTPQQIAAFYIGRKFPPEMVEVLRQQCFITFVIRNRSDHVIWLDQSRWKFRTSDQPLQSRDRSYWKSQWQEMQVPLAAQSTFRWTLLPDQLDFRPNEAEGGNVVLPRTDQPISLVATFTHRERDAKDVIEVRFDDLRCAEDRTQ